MPISWFLRATLGLSEQGQGDLMRSRERRGSSANMLSHTNPLFMHAGGAAPPRVPLETWHNDFVHALQKFSDRKLVTQHIQACCRKGPVLLSTTQAQPGRTFSQLSEFSLPRPCTLRLSKTLAGASQFGAIFH